MSRVNLMPSPAPAPAPPPRPSPAITDQEPLHSVHFVAVNPAWRKLITQAELVAPFVQCATIEGESGSGKQSLARYLHSRSPLAHSPFQRHDAREWLVHVAGSAMPSGFYYLDRVDLLAAPGQSLLLSVLKALQNLPPGRAIVIAASQTPLRQLVTQGLLIPDLAYRLTAIRFPVPPLRQRREEISPLTQSLLDRLCRRYQQRPLALGPGALARLLQHDWPGNIRELSSVLEAALLESSNGVIQADHLILAQPQTPPNASPACPPPASASLHLDAVIRSHVEYVLDLNRGNKLRAARQLGISRSTLYRILGNEPITG